MFRSDEIVDELLQGTATKDSLAALFGAKATRNGDGFSLDTLPPGVASVTMIPRSEGQDPHPHVESLEVQFSDSSTVTLTQVQPGRCHQWKRAPFVHGQPPFLYLCSVEAKPNTRVNVFAGFTREMNDSEAHLSSLLFVR